MYESLSPEVKQLEQLKEPGDVLPWEKNRKASPVDMQSGKRTCLLTQTSP